MNFESVCICSAWKNMRNCGGSLGEFLQLFICTNLAITIVMHIWDYNSLLPQMCDVELFSSFMNNAVAH